VVVGALNEVADVADKRAYGKDLRGSCAEGERIRRGCREFGFGGWRSAQGAGLLGEDVGGGYFGGGVEKGGGSGARGGFAGAGAAEVGEGRDVVGHRRGQCTTCGTADARGDARLRLCGLEKGLCLEEEEFGAAGLVEELEGAAGAGDVLLYLDGVAGVGGEHEELAVGHLMVEGLGELEAVLFGHGDVAEEESGSEGAGEGEAIGCGVDGFGLVTIGLEDKLEGVGYQLVVVDDEYTLFHETPRTQLFEGNLVVSREGGGAD
jgi:hypothetical protein